MAEVSVFLSGIYLYNVLIGAIIKLSNTSTPPSSPKTPPLTSTLSTQRTLFITIMPVRSSRNSSSDTSHSRTKARRGRSEKKKQKKSKRERTPVRRSRSKTRVVRSPLPEFGVQPDARSAPREVTPAAGTRSIAHLHRLSPTPQPRWKLQPSLVELLKKHDAP